MSFKHRLFFRFCLFSHKNLNEHFFLNISDLLKPVVKNANTRRKWPSQPSMAGHGRSGGRGGYPTVTLFLLWYSKQVYIWILLNKKIKYIHFINQELSILFSIDGLVMTNNDNVWRWLLLTVCYCKYNL